MGKVNNGIVSQLMDIIQQGYGDTTKTALDKTVATNIVNHLYNAGWVAPQELAVMVKAAGGEIVVPENLITGDTPILQRWHNPADNTWHFKTVQIDTLTENAKVNPEAESR